MILVTGASGITGSALLGRLAQDGVATRAFVRSAGGAESARAAGATEVRTGSLEDPAAVAEAMRGVRAVHHICPNVHPAEVAIGRIVVDAACREGVGHLVYHSVIQPQLATMPHHWDKLLVESLVVGSGLDYTILQPAVYMQNVRFQWRDIVERGIYAQPYRAEARLALVDIEDVAAAAVRVLTEPGWRNATFELAGTAPMDRHAMAAAITEVVGRPVQAVAEPLEAWESRTLPALGAAATARLRAMFEHYDRHGLTAGNDRVLRLLLGHAPTSWSGFVRRFAERGR